MQRNLVWVAALLAAISVGYWAGSATRSAPPTAAAPAATTTASGAAAPTPPTADDNAAPVTSYAAFERRFAHLGSSRKRAAMIAAADRMNVATIKTLLADAKEPNFYFYDSNSGAAKSILYEKWAELDPDGLIAHALTLTNHERFGALSAAFGEIARHDFEGALARMDRLPPEARDSVRFTLISTLADTEPRRAFEMARNIEGDDKFNSSASVMAKWAESEPANAKAAFAALPPGKLREECMNALGHALAPRDPDATLAWAKTLARDVEKAAVIQLVFDHLSSADPARALAMITSGETTGEGGRFSWGGGVRMIISNMAAIDFEQAKQAALGITNPARRTEALAALAGAGKKHHADELLALAGQLTTAEAKALYLGDNWWTSDTSTLAKWIDRIPEGPLKQQAVARSLFSFSYENPEEAAKQLATLKPGMLNYSSILETIASNWAGSDPDKALAWAESLRNFDQKKTALAGLYEQLANANPADSAARLARITDPRLREEITATVAGKWARRDPQKALAWVRTLSGADQQSAYRSIAESQIQSDPDQARTIIGLMSRNFTAADWKKSENLGLVGSMAGEFAETDPAAAAKFAATLPTGEPQNKAYSSVVGNWAKYAPDEAESWLDQLDDGEVRDHAAAAFVSSVASYDPEKAYQWAVSIADATERRNAAQTALAAWKANGGADAARQALESANIFTEQELKELTKSIE